MHLSTAWCTSYRPTSRDISHWESIDLTPRYITSLWWPFTYWCDTEVHHCSPGRFGTLYILMSVIRVTLYCHLTQVVDLWSDHGCVIRAMHTCQWWTLSTGGSYNWQVHTVLTQLDRDVILLSSEFSNSNSNYSVEIMTNQSHLTCMFSSIWIWNVLAGPTYTGMDWKECDIVFGGGYYRIDHQN